VIIAINFIKIVIGESYFDIHQSNQKGFLYRKRAAVRIKNNTTAGMKE